MAEGRIKKAKKARWQMVLGLKQVICGALGLTWVMMIIFILGVLAGRGDVYRWFSSWGLVTAEAPKTAQWSPPPEAPIPGPAVATAPAAPAPATSAAAPPPVIGSIAPASAPAPTAASRAKKSKKGASHRDQKAREDDARRLSREIAPKLQFQNSFDHNPPKSARTAAKKKEKAAAPGQKGQSHPVRVAQFRNLKAAKARMAELQKKGEKVALRQGKDKKGVFYDVVREVPAKQTQSDAGLAQKTQKSGENKPKRQAGVQH